jgi:hypothetical protein
MWADSFRRGDAAIGVAGGRRAPTRELINIERKAPRATPKETEPAVRAAMSARPEVRRPETFGPVHFIAPSPVRSKIIDKGDQT